MNLEFPTTAKQLGERLGAKVVGDDSAVIRDLASLETVRRGSLSFCSEKRYSSYLDSLEDGVLLTTSNLVRPELPLTYLIVKKPQKVFAQIAQNFAFKPGKRGVSPKASVDAGAQLGEGVHIGDFAVVEAGAHIGAGTFVAPHAYIGPRVEIGADCFIGTHVTLLHGVCIGNLVKIFPHSVIGSDGFGFLEDGMEMPQIGTVVVEDEVRIGALVTIDRATLGETRIGARSKLDDHVHVGHNCQIGKECILCAFVGLSGSVTLEDNVILAGQVGLADHVRVGKGARMGGQSGSNANLKGNETYFGSPAVPIKESFRLLKMFRKLPHLLERIKKIEERLNGK